MINDCATTSIGEFLLRRLREAGIEHALGVPGEFNLELMQQIEDGNDLKWIGTCNELDASYAADGYARLNGIAALIGLVFIESCHGQIRRPRGSDRRRTWLGRSRLRVPRTPAPRQHPNLIPT
jgi:hypothetical protein